MVDLFRKLGNISIKQKVTLLVILIGGVALVLAGIGFIIYDQIVYRSDIVDNLYILADIVGDNCTAALIFDSIDDARGTLSSLRAEEHILMAAIYTDMGEKFSDYIRYNTSAAEHSNENAEVIMELAGEETMEPPKILGLDQQSRQHQFQDNSLIVISPILLEEDKVGYIYIRSDLEALHTRFVRYIQIVLFILVSAICIVLLLTSRFQKIISEPILHLTKLAKQVSNNKDYTLRATKFNDDELGFLTQNFNEMLGQIEQRESTLQREIKERIEIETRISGSLAEKEVLLKEIHHRVKNNLQVISSLIYLQSKKIVESETQLLFQECQNRVKSMALIHEELYGSENFSEIDFGKYISNLLSHLIANYQVNPSDINLKVNINDVCLTIETAVPCGLIINEIISNSLKYAFPEAEMTHRGSNPEICVDLYQGTDIDQSTADQSGYTLMVSDNGVGIPENINIYETDSLGIKLITVLVRQLNGTINFTRDNGTTYHIVFYDI